MTYHYKKWENLRLICITCLLSISTTQNLTNTQTYTFSSKECILIQRSSLAGRPARIILTFSRKNEAWCSWFWILFCDCFVTYFQLALKEIIVLDMLKCSPAKIRAWIQIKAYQLQTSEWKINHYRKQFYNIAFHGIHHDNLVLAC